MPDFKLHVAEYFDAPVWRMEIDSTRNLLFLETRKSETREVSFASIDLNSSVTNYKGLTTDERWLTGIETAFDGILLIHYYESSNSPSHKGLAALDGVTGKLRWSNFNYGFDHLTADGPVVFDVRIQPRRLFILNLSTGETYPAKSPEAGQLAENHIHMPAYAPVSLLNELDAGIAPVYGNTVQYLDYNSYRIVSLHTQWAGQLRQLLYIFEDDKPVFEDLLNADIQKMQPEAFVMYKHQLIYLKNRTELKVLNL